MHWSPRASITLFATLLIAGCSWQKPKPLTEDRSAPAQSTTIHVAPKELVKRIGKKLSAPPLELSIESEQDGIILTGWHEYEGAMHIVRRWRERTRFRIHILPDYSDPLGTSHVEVFDETEEKPSDPQPWYPNPDLKRPERSEEVMKLIRESAK